MAKFVSFKAPIEGAPPIWINPELVVGLTIYANTTTIWTGDGTEESSFKVAEPIEEVILKLEAPASLKHDAEVELDTLQRYADFVADQQNSKWIPPFLTQFLASEKSRTGYNRWNR